jgi:hypothetical protein
MKLVRGDRLTASVRKAVLASFVHRWTHENAHQSYGGRCPACVQHRQCGGNSEPRHDYHVPLVTDEEWLRDHAFYVTTRGTLSAHHNHCEPAFLADDGTS